MTNILLAICAVLLVGIFALVMVLIGSMGAVRRNFIPKDEFYSIKKEQMDSLSEGLFRQRSEMSDRLAYMDTTLRESLSDLRNSNQASLDKINETVNEKLQKTLDDRLSKSFESVREQLKSVYEGLGEMRTLAGGVKDLSNILSNVKTRGIVGEYQLEALVSELLTKDQYEVQFAVTPGSAERVDFAIRLPGHESAVFLPVDSKFPGDTYAFLQDALTGGDKVAIESARKALRSTILTEAKSIMEKYIDPPYTTDFAIMFLPFEGLYSEVVNMGLLTEMQAKYHVTVTGPSTFAAMLQALRMGFRTLAIEQKSAEAWKVLEAVKKEFSTFEEGLTRTRERIAQADSELEKLVGVRTRAIGRKLRGVTSTESLLEAETILGIEEE